MIDHLVETVEAASIVLVLERFGTDSLTDSDRAWAAALHAACGAVDVPLRGMLLSHRDGVRWLAQDDYRN